MKTTIEKVHPLRRVKEKQISPSEQINSFEDNRIQMKRLPNLIQNIQLTSLIQRVVFVNKIYKTNATSVWGKNQKEDINSAITLGSHKLDKALSTASDPVIKTCIPLVKGVLTCPSLEIYKLDDSDNLALSSPKGPRQISLNIVAHSRDVNNIAKTLIHECFHIACGGLIKEETSCTESNEGALAEITGKTSSDEINPDSFAQFVMTC